MKSFWILFICLASSIGAFAQQEGTRPKVGLTLSGGGAKGLAHIGILKAIDSAGLKIDYITGTSMGAIIGALYAVGYSGKEIEQLCQKLDWDVLLSNQIPLRSLSMEEKTQYARFALELPFSNNRIKLPTGVIEGQELNIRFQELFFNVYKATSFSKLPIPFQCMATNLETGDLVVLDSGNIVNAVKASMAIPSIFTPVTIGDKRLVDGGLVRNFPVKNVKQMGADIAIGSNVSGGLSSKDRISNPVDVIMQMAFFKEAGDFREEVPLLNTYIHMPLLKYNMGSFNNSKEIMKAGDDTASRYYPVFKKLADSIRLIDPGATGHSRSETVRKIFIDAYYVTGLKKTTIPFFVHLMNFDDHKYYTATDISKAISRAYGSRYYKSITYSLIPRNGDTASIVFNAKENPGTFLKAGLYYSIFRGINVNLNLTGRDLFIPNSRSMVSVALGESFQLELEHLQYLGRTKSVAVVPSFHIDRLSINTYNNYKKDGSYKQTYYRSSLNIQNSGSNKIAAGAGTAIEYITLNPSIPSLLDQKGNFSSIKSYAFLNYNTLNQTFYPTKGIKLGTELALVYNQVNNIKTTQNGQPVNSSFHTDNYLRLVIDAATFTSLGTRFTLFTETQCGINFTDVPNTLHNFSIGGINGKFRNQVRFAGLQEASLNSAAVAAFQLGLRYSPANNIYIIGRANGLVKDFATKKNATSNASWLSGYSLTFAYKSPIGPLELSAMYSDQSKQLQSYVTFGIPF